EMNMNSVRMSHYPPDQDFLDVCDSIGLYVLDELTGWQAKYDTLVGRKLVKELVVRDVNHPSIIFWDNGNEGGWNRGLDNDYALYDPQKRVVLHPWEKFNGTDTKHYPDYDYMVKSAASGQEVFFPTEFMHGLYDGGAGAALDDFWAQMVKHPHGAGGFIWVFSDEAIIRTDKNGIYDADGNHAPDGIVGPHREKEGSFYTIKEIWSPVYIDLKSLDKGFNGQIPVDNRYSFTGLDQCTFKWKLVKFPAAHDKTGKAIVKATGIPAATDLKPGEKGILDLKLPGSWAGNDALYLSAYGPDQRELFTWSWAIKSPAVINAGLDIAKTAPVKGKSGVSASVPAKRKTGSAGNAPAKGKTAVISTETGESLLVKCDGLTYYFDKTTGYLQKVVKPSATVSLSGGPVLAGLKTSLKQFSHKAIENTYVVEAAYEGEGELQVKWTFRAGQPVKLEYLHSQQGEANFTGITFNYPEEKISGMKWLGQGPYRVWKNRLKGQQFGVWHKAYNNAITGDSWGYPEFKGYHAQVNWVVIENKESPFTVYTSNENMYLQMLRPEREMAALKNNNVEPAFPEGNIGFLNSINAIGTKFQDAKVMGPQSQKNQNNGELVNGTLWFDFIH
ncbi:MAG TPA: glycoside hydrolase family 2 TIM barrel-domain containing protein, partial [Pedobacter sp.]|nr:glycoside hydrolase family 2 TIM barrel-domain containing protein [Pedobacter sp.]